MRRPLVMPVFGTRPEAIKLAPVVRELRARPERFDTCVCVTAQHREMLDQVLAAFDVRPDVDLDLMCPGQALAELAARVLERMHCVFAERRPDCVLVQGDTTTVVASALAAFYDGVRVGHVEAGLRTGDRRAPFPEEINRRLATPLADWHFAPTACARDALLAEGVDPESVHLTGNTVVDALLEARRRIAVRPPAWPGLAAERLGERRVVAITGHRRENFGEGFRAICRAIRRLAQAHPDVAFVYPVHLNPNVRGPVGEFLDGLDNVHLLEPLEYLPFVALLQRATLILTDSGGVQEEAPTLGKPVLVMREKTERPEAIEAGTARLVGCDEERIVAETARLLADPAARAAMRAAENPYGDGRAAQRIVDVLDGALPERSAPTKPRRLP